ncbi:MAG: NADP-dependent 3-hydroxy acid dehydrogenase YdfG [Alcanivorax sp.]|jgi:NADP-dependent 3-hydroxy acid dehydrogenase YdfG|uniref:SDR family NAD(P)-dependent oxidoreductase n=1 Tax=unclassified Alcanivorax TaxID=2638842 RepID=UPI0026320F2B|nr:SDR family NAD(P)-dependent oxidoreductase [uncultured Alcanivorax sp.]
MSITLKGAVACVTGGGRGIGEATVRALVDQGARVVIGDIDLKAAQAVALSLTGVRAVKLDVADADSFENFLNVAREMGPVDLLVNNAGIMRTGAFVDLDLASLHREMAINTGGVINGMRLVLPEMQQRGYGHIVNVASMAGKMTCSGAAVYTASKFAVASLSRAVRAEIAGSGVSITTLMPSAVDTDLTAGMNIRGIPKAMPSEIAEEVIASCLHGEPEVTMPKWLFPIGTIEQALPERLGNWIKRMVGAQERIAPDNAQTRKYQERVSRS